MKIKQYVLLFCLSLTFSLSLYAQSTMSDTQVMQYMMKETEKGTERSKIVSNLIERGVSIEQIRRIRDKYEKQQKGSVPGARNISGTPNEDRTRKNNGDKRVERLHGQKQRKNSEDSVNPATLSERQRKRLRSRKEYEFNEEMDQILPDTLDLWDDFDDDYFEKYDETEKDKKHIKVFGRNIFNNRKLSFEPNMNIATPADYRLGPGDVVYVDVWGASQERYECTVTPEGVINIEGFGPVDVDGLTSVQANSRLRSTLGSRYAGSSVKLTVGQTKTITVDVMGEVHVPGSYTLSAFATVFNALYMAGGTNEIGTLRNIKIYRKGKEISTCDIYDYILGGNMKGNVRLAAGDVIIVGPYECLVEIDGKVKRPMYYEMKKTESLGTLINYSGGFTGDAYPELIRLERKAGGELQVFSVDSFNRNGFQLADGDKVTVDSTLNRYRNMVEASGALKRNGLYQMDGTITTVRQLIEAAGGLTETALTERAIIHRRKEDRSLRVIPVDLKGILNHSVADITLKNEDRLFVPSKEHIIQERTITIDGEINFPGEYEYAENTTIEDFILQAGGLKDAASVVKIDVSRRIRNQKQEKAISQIAKNYTFSLKDGFIVDGNPDFVLEPFDEVYVRRSPGYTEQQHIKVSGEIAFPGTYALSNKGMRLSDLIKVAGGLNKEAYAQGAHLERTMTAAEKIKQTSLVKLAISGDSIDMRKLELSDTHTVGINLKEAISHPGDNRWDIVLRDGDALVIPQYNNTVQINGQVMYPNTVAYNQGSNLDYYINQAGGYGLRAKKKRVFAVNMNGTVNRIRSSKDITPGCTILVPAKERRKGMSLTEILSLGSMTATLGTVIATLISK